MVRSGHGSIRPVDFEGQEHPDLQVEVLDRTDLVQRVGAEFFARPDRPSFDTLMFVHRGTGVHTVDFERVALAPGRLLRIRAGQVQGWDPHADVEATLVVSRGVAPRPPAGTAGQPASCNLGADSSLTAAALLDTLRREQRRFVGREPSIRLMAHLVGALNALMDSAQPAQATGERPAAYLAFREAIEQDLRSSHHVRDVARRIGYSERTISRACLRVTGRTAKGVLTDRLVLEAKRHLAHTDRTVTAIASELGFTEPTNFHKAFVRETGLSPTRFRAEHRGNS